MDISYIFFDIGYTLADEDRVWSRRCEEQASTREARAMGLTPAMIYRELVLASQQYLPPYRTLLEKYGLTETVPYRYELERLYGDARPVLEELSGRYTLGVIANQSAGLRDKLREWGIEGFFSIVVSSAEHHIKKPDSRLFSIALNQAGCRPEEALMVGDRLDNDIAPAKALGFRTAWIRQGFGGKQLPVSEKYRPDMTAASLTELAERLR